MGSSTCTSLYTLSHCWRLEVKAFHISVRSQGVFGVFETFIHVCWCIQGQRVPSDLPLLRSSCVILFPSVFACDFLFIGFFLFFFLAHSLNNIYVYLLSRVEVFTIKLFANVITSLSLEFYSYGVRQKRYLHNVVAHTR